MKKYRIRPNSPADVFIGDVLPILVLIGIIILGGIMNSYELGLL